MPITDKQLAKSCDCPLKRAQPWVAPLNAAMAAYEISLSPQREAAFLAQIGHESGRLQYVREIWGPTPAQKRYEGRQDLGNTQKGDGSRFRGRGLIQMTGRANYGRTRDGLRKKLGATVPDFEAEPQLLEQPDWAALSAAWFWFEHGLNELADAGKFEAITKRINGGLNGQPDRLALWDKSRAALA